MAAIRRNKNLAAVCVYPYNCYPVDLRQVARKYSLNDEVQFDSFSVLTLFTKSTSGFSPLRVSKSERDIEDIWWIKGQLVDGNAYPVILEKPFKEYEQYKYIFVDDNFHLQGLNKLSFKQFFFRHPKGWRNGGIIKR